MIRRLSIAVLAAAMLTTFSSPSPASTLTLDTGKSVTLLQGTSGTFTFSATNDAGAITDDFLGWAIGFQVLPSGSTSGLITVGALSSPAVNPMPIGTVQLIQPGLFPLANSASLNGSPNFYAMGMTSEDTLGSLAEFTSYNLANVALSASGDAVGTWNVYAVQQAGAFIKTFWNNAATADVTFGNLPQSGNSSILIGTVTVTAVPEPSTISLAGFALVAAGWAARRRSRRSA